MENKNGKMELEKRENEKNMKREKEIISLTCNDYPGVERASDICFVDIPSPISNNNVSYVQTLMFLDKQSATNSSSLECLLSSSLALDIKDSYSSKGTRVILLNTRVENVLNLFSERLDLKSISALCLKYSSLSFDGESILNLLLNISLRISPPEINVLNTTLESITTSIYIPLSFKLLCIDSLTLSDISSASFSVNLLLDTISSAIANSSLSTNSFTTLAKANSNSLLNSGDTSTLIIISSIGINVEIVYKKLSVVEETGRIKMKDMKWN